VLYKRGTYAKSPKATPRNFEGLGCGSVVGPGFLPQQRKGKGNKKGKRSHPMWQLTTHPSSQEAEIRIEVTDHTGKLSRLHLNKQARCGGVHL
jgi:hypothetical protein